MAGFPGLNAGPVVADLAIRTPGSLRSFLSDDEYVLPAGLCAIEGSVDLEDKALRLSTGTVLRGLADASITSSVTGGVVRSTNIGSHLVMREFSIIATGGPCLNLTGTIDYQCNLFFLGLIGTDAGTITGFDVQAVKDCYINAAAGITLAGTTNKVFVDRSPFYGVTGSAITLDSTLAAEVADISTCFFKFDAPGVGVTAEAGYSVGEGKVRGSLIGGTATPLSGLAPSDVGWTMTDNSGIRDSRTVGSLSLTSSATTTITTVSTPVKVAGTTSAAALNERFSHSNNRLTYTGVPPALVRLDAVVSVATSNNTALNFYIAKNGSVIPESESRVRVGSGQDERQATVQVIAEAVTNDYFEVWVENITDDSDLTCATLKLVATT